MDSNFTVLECIEGTVTSVNRTLCSFSLKINDDTAQIHTALARIYIPESGSRIAVLHLYQRNGNHVPANEQHYYLDKKSTIRSEKPGTNCTPTTETKLYHLCRKMQFRIVNLAEFMEKQLKVLPKLFAETPDEINVGVLEYLFNSTGSYNVILNVPSDVEYIKLKHDYINENGLKYSHGIHHSEMNEHLIGCFRVNSHSMFELTDGYSARIIKIQNTPNYKLLEFVDKLVCITKYTVITEMFDDGLNLLYVLCDVNHFDVFNFGLLPEFCGKVNLFEKVPKDGFLEVYTLKILNIGMPNSTAIQTIECWMRVLMKRNNSWDECCLCFEQVFFHTLRLLDIGPFYEIHLQNKLINFTDPEISRVSIPTNCFKVIGQCAFVMEDIPKGIVIPSKPILTLKQLKEVLASKRKERVDFEGVVTLKFMATNNGSTRTPRQINSQVFGTSGTMTHILQFEDKLEDIKVNLYLNNWERKMCPLGCVPWMRLIVREAEIGNSSYLKSTALTTFQIIRYEAPCIFSTMNLNPENKRVFYGNLNLGNYIPYNVVVRAQTSNVKLRSFLLNYNGELKLKATLNSSGATILCSNMNFVKKLLSNNYEKFDMLENAMKVVRKYTFTDFPSNITISDEHQLLFQRFTDTLNSCFSDEVRIVIDWVLMRIEKYKSDNATLPLWLCKDINYLQINGERM